VWDAHQMCLLYLINSLRIIISAFRVIGYSQTSGQISTQVAVRKISIKEDNELSRPIAGRQNWIHHEPWTRTSII